MEGMFNRSLQQIVGLIVILVGSVSVANAQLSDVPQGDITVGLEIITGGLDQVFDGTAQITPIDYAVLPGTDGRALVGTLGGVIRVVEKNGTLLGGFIDTSDDLIASYVLAGNGEYGFHSIAIHPGFADSQSAGFQKFYTLGSRSGNGSGPGHFADGIANSNHNSVLVEWTVTQLDNSTLNATSRQVLSVDQPAQSHNVVDMAFDANGLLYISSGDGGGNNQVNGTQNRSLAAQDPANLYGTILRIDPIDPDNDPNNATSYSVPQTNHFAADGDASTLAEIYAIGQRSPFRINFDRQDIAAQGANDEIPLYVGNVGQGQIETIFRIGNGENARWGRFEGSQLLNNNVVLEGTTSDAEILFEYDHDDGRSIVGGFVYRGSAIPALFGKYVFGDLGQNNDSARLFYGDLDTGDVFELQIDSLLEALPERLLSIAEDADGELLLLAGTDPRTNGSGAFGLEGVIIRVVPEPASLMLVGLGAMALLNQRRRAAR